MEPFLLFQPVLTYQGRAPVPRFPQDRHLQSAWSLLAGSWQGVFVCIPASGLLNQLAFSQGGGTYVSGLCGRSRTGPSSPGSHVESPNLFLV